MKRTFILLSLLGMAVTASSGPIIGKPAPDFAATDIRGQTVKLSDYKGRIVVLEAYTSVELGVGCDFCVTHYKSGAMQELQRELTNQGVVWLLIGFDARQTPAEAKQEWTNEKMGISDYIIDARGFQIGRRYAMKTVPSVVVIDKNGNLAYQGAFDNLGDWFGPGTPASRMPLAARRNAIFSTDPRQARNYLREAVVALLAGKTVPVPETKPLGCPLHIYSN